MAAASRLEKRGVHGKEWPAINDVTQAHSTTMGLVILVSC